MFDCGMIKNRKTKQYLLVICGVCLAAFVLYLISIWMRQTGSYVVVTCDGVEKVRFLLSEDLTYDIETPEGVNRLEIKDGSARIISADCSNQVCVYTKAVRYVNETIVCLPHKVTVSVAGAEEGAYDAVSN